MKKGIQINDGALLAIQLGDIGDVVLTLPSLRALKKAFPKIIWWFACEKRQGH
jgi:ADP-heptose:LPS heptosyltransferase